MSDSNKPPKPPPPDDFSKTTPNINLPDDDDSSGMGQNKLQIPCTTTGGRLGKYGCEY